jgi:predicted lipoprotein with Yx(FWY)xxD motif
VRNRIILAAATAVVAVVALAACSGGGSSSAGSSSSQSAAQAPKAGNASSAVQLGTATTKLGTVVVDAQGMTVYVFDKDTANSGTSACTGQCLTAWPPVTTTTSTPTVSGVTGKVATIPTPDGTKQLTLNGLPLYTYSGDSAKGDVTGQALQGIWWAISPSGDKVTGSASGY